MPTCIYCSKPLSLLERLRDPQFCSENHRTLYLRDSRWFAAPIRQSPQPLCGLMELQPPAGVGHGKTRLGIGPRPVTFPRAIEGWPTLPCRPRTGLSVDSSRPVPLSPAAPRPGQRRRFLYGWGYQLILNRSLAEARERLAQMKMGAAMSVCAPAGGSRAIPLLLVAAERSDLAWRPLAGIDDSWLGNIAVQLFEPEDQPIQPAVLRAVGSAVPVRASYAELGSQKPLDWLDASGCGFFLPRVCIAPLRPCMAFGLHPPQSQAGGDRRANVIPISEFQTSSETRLPVPSLARARTS